MLPQTISILLSGIMLFQIKSQQYEKIVEISTDLKKALVKQPNLRKRGNMRGLVRQKQKVYW